MIKVSPGIEPSEDLVTRIIDRHIKKYLPRFQRLEEYYKVENQITNRQLPPDKPNNRIPHGFAKYITNMATGYFMGQGVRFEADDENYKEKLSLILEKNAASDVNFETAKEASKKGASYELLYMNEESDIRFKRFTAEEMIPVYSYSVGEFLEFAIRIWSEEDLVSGKTVNKAEVYTKAEIITYQKDRQKYKETGDRRAHHFDDVPVIVYWNNEEIKGDYEDVIALVDAYDKSQSDTSNDFEYFTDAYLVLIGSGGGVVDEDGEDDAAWRTLRQQRIMLMDSGSDAKWLIKDINDTAVENFKNRLYNDIFFLSQVPALTDESFAGNLSGIALRYKMTGLDQLAVMKENKFRAAYRKKIRLITNQLNLKLGTDFDPSTVTVKFDRNMADNLKELADIVAELKGTVSNETLLQLLPFIKDSVAEREKVLAERKQEDLLGLVEEYQNLIGSSQE